MLQGEHSVILLTFITLPSVINTFALSLLSDYIRQVLLKSKDYTKRAVQLPPNLVYVTLSFTECVFVDRVL